MPTLETVFGCIRGDTLYHSGNKKEKITFNQFKRDIPYTYIQIKRENNRIYIVDFF